MEEIVAVAVALANGQKRYFLTWGRIQDSVDTKPLEDLILTHAVAYDLGGRPTKAYVCESLQAAAGEPYFYEGLCYLIARRGAPNISEAKRNSRLSKLMKQGKGFYYLGRKRR
jgi:hypothetical protein